MACLCALSSNFGSTLVNGQHFATLSLRLWLGDWDFLRLEAVVIETVSVSDWYSIFGLRLIDFSWRVAQGALHFFAASSPALYPS